MFAREGGAGRRGAPLQTSREEMGGGGREISVIPPGI